MACHLRPHDRHGIFRFKLRPGQTVNQPPIMPEVIVRKGEPVDRALKRLKNRRWLDSEGIMDEVRRPARLRDAHAEDQAQGQGQRQARQGEVPLSTSTPDYARSEATGGNPGFRRAWTRREAPASRSAGLVPSTSRQATRRGLHRPDRSFVSIGTWRAGSQSRRSPSLCPYRRAMSVMSEPTRPRFPSPARCPPTKARRPARGGHRALRRVASTRTAPWAKSAPVLPRVHFSAWPDASPRTATWAGRTFST